MKAFFLQLFAASLMLCMVMALTACDTEFSNDTDGSQEDCHAGIANTRWQLAEVMNDNSQWVRPDAYAELDIPEMSFGYSNSYFMRICTSDDRQDVTYINGTYSIDKYFSITINIDHYQGIAYTFNVFSLKDNILEGEFIDWQLKQWQSDAAGAATTHNPRHYTIRMKRIGQ